MTTTGSGVGGAMGGPQQPTIFELETKGGTDVARAAMKIVADTIELPLLSVDQDTRKYQSSANRPTIPVLYTTRVAVTYDPVTDDSWQSSYQELIQLMPKDFREFYDSAMQLSVDQRNRNITILDNVLQSSAKLLNAVRRAALPLSPESLAIQRADDNIAQPYIAFNTLTLNSSLLIAKGLEYLEIVGPNNPDFDRIAGALGDFALIAEDLKTAANLLTSPDTEVEGRSLIAEAYDQIAKLSEQFDRVGGDGSFLILGQMMHTAKLCCAALLLKDPGASALLFGISNATYDIDKSGTSLGILGPGYAAFSQALADNLQSLYLKDSSAGDQLLGHGLVETSLLTMLFLGTLAYDGKKPLDAGKESSPSEVSEQNLTHELTLNFLTGSDILSSISNIIAKGSGASSSQQTSLATLLESGLMMMLIAPSIKGGDLATTGPLLKGLSNQLNGNITAATKAISSADSDGSISQNLKVYLQQAEIAIENHDDDGLINAIGNALELTGATISQFVSDIKNLKETAYATSEALNLSRNVTANTGITQAA